MDGASAGGDAPAGATMAVDERMITWLSSSTTAAATEAAERRGDTLDGDAADDAFTDDDDGDDSSSGNGGCGGMSAVDTGRGRAGREAERGLAQPRRPTLGQHDGRPGEATGMARSEMAGPAGEVEYMTPRGFTVMKDRTLPAELAELPGAGAGVEDTALPAPSTTPRSSTQASR